MPRLSKHPRSALIVCTYLVGGVALIFAVLVIGRSALRTLPVQAASTVLYPKFCLGGWRDPQHAAGAASLSADDPAQSYSTANSAVLDAAVSAQLFCGYFASIERTHQPSKVTVRFQWSMKSADGAQAESLSSFSGQQVIATSTGLNVPVATSSTVNSQTTSTPSSSQTVPATPSPSSDVSSSTPSAPSSMPTPVATSTTETVTDEVSTSSPQTPPTPPTTQENPPATTTPAPSDTETASTTTSFLWKSLMNIIAKPAYAASPDPTQSDSPFLQVSYSVDGVRWVAIGTVGLDNWKDYQVAVPVSSWADVSNLQIMVTVMPSTDKKPDIYLDSLAADVSYDRTVGEAISDAVDTASNALDSAANALTGADKQPQQPAPPHEVTIVSKKLVFSAGNAVPEARRKGNSSIKASASSDGASLTISGPCAKKYYVVMIFKDPTDYIEKPSAALSNGAWECKNGSFSYDISSMSPDTPSGAYYLVTGEEGDTGSWTPISSVYPITITGSTTETTVLQP